MVEVLTEETKKAWAEEYQSYPSVTPDGFEGRHEARIAPILYEIPLGSKVLDVGANDGEFMKLLREKRDCDVYGIDMSDVAIAKAKEKGIDVIKAEVDKIPFPDATFDYVTLNEVLSHLADPEAALREIRRVLKPEGALLGSTPHENLERYLWDDKRKHRRYLDETGLRDLLEPIFPFAFIRTLSGAQFAVAMSMSVMAKEPAEMLFKAGGEHTTDWEAEQMADDKLRVWFGYTQLAGTVYYRMLGFAEKMDKLGLVQAAYERCSWEEVDERSRSWQTRIRNKVVINQLENILRVAHVSVWQITANRDVLAFLRCARDLMNGQWMQATGTRRKIVTEIDDDFFDIPAYNVASHPYHPASELEWVAQQQIELSDALICSTQFLKEKLSAMFPGKPIYLVPNSIDFDIWDNLKPEDALPPKEEGMIRIGYTGCSNHRGDLEMIREPMEAILREFPNVQFVVTPQPSKEGVTLGWGGLSNIAMIGGWALIDKYPAFLAGWGLDIGIAPLRDSNFNRAKSNLRWLEYSALKIPTVASRVYPFRHSINDGEDGLICNTSQEWYDNLKSLVLDHGRRRELGDRAYVRVKRDYSMAETARKYHEILQRITSHEPIRPRE